MAKVPAEEMRRQLGSWLERAVETLGDVRAVVVRTSQIGKIKLDATFLRRERDRLFARLGEEVFDRVETGRLELSEELSASIEQLREIERRLEEQEAEIVAVEADTLARRLARDESRREAEELAASLREGKWDEEEWPEEEPIPGTAEPVKDGDEEEMAVDFSPVDVVKEAPPPVERPAGQKRRRGRRPAVTTRVTPGVGGEER